MNFKTTMQTVRSNYLSSSALISQISKMEGIDISHHQKEIDWKQLTPDSSGKTFIIAKATEGATYQDPRFIENFKHAAAAGFWPGAYHFLRFGSSAPSDQMKNFVAQIEAAKATLPGILANKEPIIALDIEERNGSDYTLVQRVTEESVRYLRDQARIIPYIYTRTSFWNKYVPETPDIVQQCPLWIARWRATPPLAEELPRGWHSWKLWQYTDQGAVPGIMGKVDLNRMQMAW